MIVGRNPVVFSMFFISRSIVTLRELIFLARDVSFTAGEKKCDAY